ncbi:TetR/AcrR family transcriptional regulator [Bacillus sp. 03113]|uniref:TetR/AcrR family transcriptional regulator n=1 Tax=Bacillus sp. 03113 TaxID=2578211 RepID=UPI001142B85E|nr:TetR/AcrR family transcriptional regulator [Bacillus sp. 03113]
MGINERKQKEKEIRRNDIIDAAERVFFAKGYSAATMDDVSKEAEFSKRTVYVYFNSKEQIYFEIMLRGYRLLKDMLEKEWENKRAGDSLNYIRKMGRILFDFSKKYPDYFEAIVEYENGEKDFDKGVTDQSREECYTLGEQVFGFLIYALKDGVEEGGIRRDLDLKNTALILWSCVVGVFTMAKRKSNYFQHFHQKNSEDLIPEAFELLIRSIQS